MESTQELEKIPRVEAQYGCTVWRALLGKSNLWPRAEEETAWPRPLGRGGEGSSSSPVTCYLACDKRNFLGVESEARPPDSSPRLFLPPHSYLALVSPASVHLCFVGTCVCTGLSLAPS